MADDLIRRIRTATAKRLEPERRMAPDDQAFQNADIDRLYWRDGIEPPPRVGGYAPVDDHLFKIPTMEERGGEDPPPRYWVTGQCPPWNCKGRWAKPFELENTICVPTWEQEYNILSIPGRDEMEMVVVESVSYHIIVGLSQYDLFVFTAHDNSSLKVEWEDMLIDPTTSNPSDRYVFASDIVPLRMVFFVDRNHTARFRFRARGITLLDGTSNHNPGDPLNPNAYVRLSVQGYYAPIRRNVDGGPRPQDLGLMANYELDEQLSLEGL